MLLTLSPELYIHLGYSKTCKIVKPNFYIIDFLIKKEVIMYKIAEEGKIRVEMLS